MENPFLLYIEKSNNDLLSLELFITESLSDYYTEALDLTKDNSGGKDIYLFNSIKKFFVKLIANIQEFNRKVIIEVQYRVQRFVSRSGLKREYKRATELKSQGGKIVEVYNAPKICNYYNSTIVSLSPLFKRIQKNQYNDLDSMDKDLMELENNINTAYRAIDVMSKEKIKVTIDEYIKFLEREINGNSTTFKTMDTCEKELKLMQSEALKLENQRKSLGPEIIGKKISIFKRVSLAITKFIKKILTTIVGLIYIF